MSETPVTREDMDRTFREAMEHFENCKIAGCHPTTPCTNGAMLLVKAAQTWKIGKAAKQW